MPVTERCTVSLCICLMAFLSAVYVVPVYATEHVLLMLALHVLSMWPLLNLPMWGCYLGMLLTQAVVLAWLNGLLTVMWPSLSWAKAAELGEMALWLWLVFSLLSLLASVCLAHKDSGLILAGHQLVSRLQIAEFQRKQWYAVIQHDLWQPLKSVQLYGYALTQAAPAEQARLHTGMQLAAQHVGEFVHHLGAWSELEPAELSHLGQFRPLSAHDLLLPLVTECMPLAHWHRVSLGYRKNNSLVITHAFAVQRMLRNLIHNALTYTPVGGRVLIGCRRRSGLLWIWCVDNGRGMSAEQLAMCTQAYSRFAPAVDDVVHHGLGLFSFCQLAKQMGLPLRMVSTPGKGSLFGFALPLA